MIRRYKLGRDVELHKRTVELGAAVARSALTRRDRRRSTAEHDNARASSAAPVTLVRTDVGVDIFCAAERAGEVKRARSACPRSTRRRPRSSASSTAARATASTSTTP